MSQFDEADTSKLKIKNYSIHPTNRSYWVIFYSDDQMADLFKELLIREEISFEEHSGEDLVKKRLFGVHKKDMSKALELNNIAIGKYRKPFIGDPIFRYFLILLSVLLLGLAIYGYFKNPDRIKLPAKELSINCL
ncbi:MAG: hypothetical protein AAF487_03635 [Bacteroidota bacterium]